jgi:hypothetical protein
LAPRLADDGVNDPITRTQRGTFMKSEHCKRRIATALLTAMLIGLPATVASAAEEVPQTTPDGMHLIRQTQSRLVYAMPEATLDGYTKVFLVDCYVAFEKNWERDYNRDASFDRRVDAKDMERIKQSVADEFRKVFIKELTAGGHEIVDYAGPEVVVVRPAIINLRVNAPDIMSAGFVDVVVRSAGSMTLYMELLDSTTSATFARIMDAQGDRESFAGRANSVTNKAAADRILGSWARELAAHLGAAREAIAGASES